MADRVRRTVIYRGPAQGAIAFVEALDRHRVKVAYDPPFESRSQFENPEAVTIFYHLTAPERLIERATADFERSGFARVAYLTHESVRGGAASGC